MPSNISDFLGGSKPKLITRYTSGTGTYYPTVNNARCFVKIQGSGGGGAVFIGGGGGAYIEGVFVVPSTGVPYTVGAGGAGGTGSSASAGNYSRFDSIKAPGGSSGGYFSNSGNFSCSQGGIFNEISYTTSSTVYPLPASGILTVSGGFGGYGASLGGAVGSPVGIAYASGTQTVFILGNQTSLSSFNTAPSGGDAYLGVAGAGTATNGQPGNGYGSGGGGANTGYTGGAGAGGLVEIWDYGA
jgi:hypothetical protein